MSSEMAFYNSKWFASQALLQTQEKMFLRIQHTVVINIIK